MKFSQAARIFRLQEWQVRLANKHATIKAQRQMQFTSIRAEDRKPPKMILFICLVPALIPAFVLFFKYT